MKHRFIRRRDPLIRKLNLMEESDTDRLLEQLCDVQSPQIVGFLNQHGYNIAQKDTAVFRNFSRFNYLLRDGIGIKLACELNGLAPKANLNGSDFIPRLIDRLIRNHQGSYEFFAMGTMEPWLSKGSRALFQGHAYHGVDGFQSIEAYLAWFRSRRTPGKTPVVVLAMGMPKQEELAVRLQREIDGPALLICGGAILDFAAQRFPRAPTAFRKTGLEWAFRLMMEPRRLFNRYAVGIPLFFFYLSRNAMGTPLTVQQWSVVQRERLLARQVRSAVKPLTEPPSALRSGYRVKEGETLTGPGIGTSTQP
ncbi:WecB/TagA/CpsF family glycosyltransferase [Stutzerimonas tarimensis]|uniref:WecB/TagA/CpsF family glycosyltransferase n=1 Tax=Stutzerimonas tarimensis TaxID=1507735 RepID=A0ABV7T6N2_9GAMM